MTSTVFTPGTVVASTWLNDVNTTVYQNTAPFVNTIPMSAAAINNMEVSLLRFIPESEHAAILAGTSTLDVTTYVNNALSSMKYIHIPRGTYKVNGSLLVTHRVHMRGDGMYLSLFSSGVTGTTDALSVIPTTGGAGDYTYYDFRDFGITPQVAGNGRNGMRVTTDATTYFSNFDISRLYVGDFGAEAIVLNNAPTSQNAFFRGRVATSWLTNGIKGISIGDTINICENTITGTRLTTPGINLSGLAGARQVVVQLNNVSTQSGSVELLNMEQCQLYNNQFEHPGYIGNYTGGLNSQVYIGNCYGCDIRGNTIGPGNVTFPAITPADYALLFDGTSIYNNISSNVIQRGRLYHVGFLVASCQSNNLDKSNVYAYPTSPVAIVDNSVSLPNFGSPKAVSFSNSWVAFDSVSTPNVEIIDGMTSLRGSIKNGTVNVGDIMFTLPSGFTSPTATKLIPVTTSNGSAYLTGTVVVGTDGTVRVGQITAGYNVQVNLDNIKFRLD